MRFLTNSKAKKWILAQGMSFHPDLRAAVLEICRKSGQQLLMIEDHPLTQDDRRERLIDFRKDCGEIRPLTKSPAILQRTSDDIDLREFLDICIGPGSWWTLWIYLSNRKVIISIRESSSILLWSPSGNEVQLLGST